MEEIDAGIAVQKAEREIILKQRGQPNASAHPSKMILSRQYCILMVWPYLGVFLSTTWAISPLQAPSPKGGLRFQGQAGAGVDPGRGRPLSDETLSSPGVPLQVAMLSKRYDLSDNRNKKCGSAAQLWRRPYGFHINHMRPHRPQKSKAPCRYAVAGAPPPIRLWGQGSTSGGEIGVQGCSCTPSKNMVSFRYTRNPFKGPTVIQ